MILFGPLTAHDRRMPTSKTARPIDPVTCHPRGIAFHERRFKTMPRMTTAAILVALKSTILLGQTTTQPQFAVASIRPNTSTDPRRYITGMQRGDLKAINYTLKDLIRLGWDVRSYEISGGPKWLDSDRYNIEAKPEVPLDVPGPGNEGDHRLRLMVQAMLADRFKLKLHRETKEVSVYLLVIGRNGPRLKQTREPADQGPHIQDSKGKLIATKVDMPLFSRALAGELGVTVIDRTNLSGAYDLNLEWNPDEDVSAAVSSSGPSIFTALQEQLGLRLESGKAPVDVVVVDYAEKASAN
jgi:uncharacterized protein (TIGR03435 family)